MAKQSWKATGRRKRAVAQVTLVSGTGNIVINGVDVNDYMPDKILVLDDNGILTVLDMEGDSLKISSRKKVLPGADSWGPMAFSSGLLLLRDSTELVCLDLRKQKK